MVRSHALLSIISIHCVSVLLSVDNESNLFIVVFKVLVPLSLGLISSLIGIQSGVVEGWDLLTISHLLRHKEQSSLIVRHLDRHWIYIMNLL